MAKKKLVVAVTNIKNNGEFIPAGDVLDVSKFTRVQLTTLSDLKSITVVEVDVPEVTADKATPPVVATSKKEEKEFKVAAPKATPNISVEEPKVTPVTPVTAKKTTAARTVTSPVKPASTTGMGQSSGKGSTK